MSPAAIAFLQNAVENFKQPDALCSEEHLQCLVVLGDLFPQMIADVRRIVEASANGEPAAPPARCHLSIVP